MAEEVGPMGAAPTAVSQATRALRTLRVRRILRSTPRTLSQEIWAYLLGGRLPCSVYWLDKDTHSRKTKRRYVLSCT
eukprot:8951569-Pyramimonas_sp.AAC.1